LIETQTSLRPPDLAKSNQPKARIPEIPPKVIIGYGSCNDPIIDSVQNGVNVLIWIPFVSIKLESIQTDSGNILRSPTIVGGPDLSCVKRIQKQLYTMGYSEILHLISFGGWNTPHFDFEVDITSHQLYQAWKNYNQEHLFHGFDWDFEGNSQQFSPINHYSLTCLNQMGEMSQFAKEDGYIVTMAPPESYLDFTNNDFSRYVNLTYPKDDWHFDFSFHGRNLYSYILAKYGTYIDLISIQLYESYSHASYHINYLGTSPSVYLVELVNRLLFAKYDNQPGYWVQFSQDSSIALEDQFVHIPLSKLVLGVASGWAETASVDKSVYISPMEIAIAYENMHYSTHNVMEDKVRGVMFWKIGSWDGMSDFIFGLQSALHIHKDKGEATI